MNPSIKWFFTPLFSIAHGHVVKVTSNVVPLVVVVAATMGKEAVEDWKRKKQNWFLENSSEGYCGEGVVRGKVASSAVNSWLELF
ncbi:hypothetical protein JHK82_015907 [Glycine max]|nr:hypothetical protein JHK82_015907 [Glycine max]